MADPFGVGSQMEKMFGWFLIHAGPDCPCHEHAREYDDWGPDVCFDRMETILDRLAEQASMRGLPFSRIVVRRFVILAINKARRGKPL